MKGKVIDDAWLLAIIATVLTVIAYSLAVFTGYSSNLLIIFGLLSGIIYAMTNANDRRAMHGRPILKEDKSFDDVDFLAVAGVIGVILTWFLVTVLYAVFASALKYSLNWETDARMALQVPFNFIPGIPVPGFIFAGAFTVASTYAYLKLLGSKTLNYLAVLLPLVLIADIVVGVEVFQDTILEIERIIFAGMIILIFSMHFSKPKIEDYAEKSKEQGNSYQWLALFLVFSFLTDLSTRGSLSMIEAKQQFFVSLWFRAAYFSMFVAFFLYWWIKYKRESIITKLRRSGRMRLVLVTPITFSLAFALKVPVIANNLAIGSLASFVGNILMLSLVGIFYKTDGKSPKWQERLREVYIGEGNRQTKYIYPALYAIFIVIVSGWFYIRLLA